MNTRVWIFAFVFILPFQLTAGVKKVKSGVKAVTVYSDRVLIQRTAKEHVVSGVQTLALSELPLGIIDESLKVSGESETDVKISDIKVETIYADSIPVSKSAELAMQRSRLGREKAALERRLAILQSEMALVDSIKSNYAKSIAAPNAGQKASVDEWEKLFVFVEKKKNELLVRMQELQDKIEGKNGEISEVMEKYSLLQSRPLKKQKQVLVTINAAKSAALTLTISYFMQDADWTPTYELRVSSNERKAQLAYFGMVRQSTGEDWADVAVSLSTAKPMLSAVFPVPQRWQLSSDPQETSEYSARSTSVGRASDVSTANEGNTITGKVTDAQTGEPLRGANCVIKVSYQGAATDVNGDFVIKNLQAGTYTVRVSFVGYTPMSFENVPVTDGYGARITARLYPANISNNEVVVTAQRPTVQRDYTSSTRVVGPREVESEQAESRTVVTSTVFTLASKQTIPSDGYAHRVGIALQDIPMDFAYDAVPRIIEAAFLTAKGKNANEFPLLGGTVNIFLDNTFVTTSPFKLIMPGDSLKVSLGTDEGIRISRKQVKRFAENIGTFSKKRRISFVYELKIENHKAVPVTIAIHEPVPTSTDEKFTIELTEPAKTELVPDEKGILNWKVELKAGETRTLRIAYAVEFPREQPPYGLE